MIILEQPYVSEFLQQTIVRLQIPVLATDYSCNLEYAPAMNLMQPGPFFNKLKEAEYPLLFSNSENSTELVNQYGPDLQVTKNLNFFKDKSKLREIFSALNPEMWFRRIKLEDLADLDVATLSFPFVIKPVRGFASIGIHAVHHRDEWNNVLENIRKEVTLMRNVFPDVVVSLDDFLLEKYIEGTEIAIDAYFNHAGEPVILNILTHLFSPGSDMSDRLYMTSAEIIRKYHGAIVQYLEQISRLRDLRNFPFHLEMRQEPGGTFIPIEINPMRFMGFCVADVEHYFYGINPYEYYFLQKRPDWDTILASRGHTLYGMFGIDIPKHLDKSKIRFNYDRFIGHFSKVLHHTKMDYTKFPVAIYLFAEVPENRFSEFETILYSDLSEFIDQE